MRLLKRLTAAHGAYARAARSWHAHAQQARAYTISLAASPAKTRAYQRARRR